MQGDRSPESAINNQILQEYKKRLCAFSLWEIINLEQRYSEKINKIQKNPLFGDTFSLNNLSPRNQHKTLVIWKKTLEIAHKHTPLLAIIQEVKHEKIRNYVLYGISITGIALACCVFCYWWIEHKDEAKAY